MHWTYRYFQDEKEHRWTYRYFQDEKEHRLEEMEVKANPSQDEVMILFS